MHPLQTSQNAKQNSLRQWQRQSRPSLRRRRPRPRRRHPRSPLRRPSRQAPDSNDRSHGPATKRRLHLQRSKMPPARKSHARARRNRRLLPLPNPSNRRHPSKSNSLPRRHSSPNATKHKSLHKRIPRGMARVSRHATSSDVSPSLSTTQSSSKIRSLERSTKSDGCPRPKSQKRHRRSDSALPPQTEPTWPSH